MQKILESSTTNLKKNVMVDSINREPWYVDLADDNSRCRAENIVSPAVCHQNVCLEVMIKMVWVGLGFVIKLREKRQNIQKALCFGEIYYPFYRGTGS